MCRPGKVLEGASDPAVEAGEARLVTVPKGPKTIHSINDNYYVVDVVPVTWSLNVVPSVKDKNYECHCSNKCILFCCQSCTFCYKCQKTAANERLKSSTKKQKQNKLKSASIVDHCVLVPPVSNVPNVAHVQLVGGRL